MFLIDFSKAATTVSHEERVFYPIKNVGWIQFCGVKKTRATQRYMNLIFFKSHFSFAEGS